MQYPWRESACNVDGIEDLLKIHWAEGHTVQSSLHFGYCGVNCMDTNNGMSPGIDGFGPF